MPGVVPGRISGPRDCACTGEAEYVLVTLLLGEGLGRGGGPGRTATGVLPAPGEPAVIPPRTRAT